MPRQSTINKSTELKGTAKAVFTQSTALTETIKMPSKGLISGVPEEIVIKAIQRKDKKKILMSETDDVLLALLQS